jgi:hypothetical protein
LGDYIPSRTADLTAASEADPVSTGTILYADSKKWQHVYSNVYINILWVLISSLGN